jgi:hypothetical protein
MRWVIDRRSSVAGLDEESTFEVARFLRRSLLAGLPAHGARHAPLAPHEGIEADVDADRPAVPASSDHGASTTR